MDRGRNRVQGEAIVVVRREWRGGIMTGIGV